MMNSREKIRKHISDRQVRFMLNEEEDILTGGVYRAYIDVLPEE